MRSAAVGRVAAGARGAVMVDDWREGRTDRRRKEDIWVKILRSITGLTYAMIAVFAFLLFVGAPLYIGFIYMLIGGVFMTSSGIYINSKRTRRKYDDDQLPMLAFGLFVMVGMIIYAAYF